MNKPFTDSYADRDELRAGSLVWVALGKGKTARSLPGIVKGNHFKGVLYWVDVEVQAVDLAGVAHTSQVAVHMTQLSRRTEEKESLAGGSSSPTATDTQLSLF